MFILLISRVIGSKSTVLIEKKGKTVEKISSKFCKNSLNAHMFLQVLEKRGKNPLFGQRVKTMVTVDCRPPNCRFEPKKKPFEGTC